MPLGNKPLPDMVFTKISDAISPGNNELKRHWRVRGETPLDNHELYRQRFNASLQSFAALVNFGSIRQTENSLYPVDIYQIGLKKVRPKM